MVDITATAYEWYHTANPDERDKKFRWEPENGRIYSSITGGRLVLHTPDAEYVISELIPWVAAYRFASDAGFTFFQAFHDKEPGISGGEVSWKIDQDCIGHD